MAINYLSRLAMELCKDVGNFLTVSKKIAENSTCGQKIEGLVLQS